MADAGDVYCEALSTFRGQLETLRDDLVAFREEHRSRHERQLKILLGQPKPASLPEQPRAPATLAPLARAQAAKGGNENESSSDDESEDDFVASLNTKTLAQNPGWSALNGQSTTTPSPAPAQATAEADALALGASTLLSQTRDSSEDSQDSFMDLTPALLQARYREAVVPQKMKEAGLISDRDEGKDNFMGFTIGQVVPLTGRLSELLATSKVSVTALRCGPESDRVEVEANSGPRHQVRAAQLAASALGLSKEEAQRLDAPSTAPTTVPAALQKYQADPCDNVVDPTSTVEPLMMFLEGDDVQVGKEDDGAVAALTMGMMQKRFSYNDAPLPVPGSATAAAVLQVAESRSKGSDSDSEHLGSDSDSDDAAFDASLSQEMQKAIQELRLDARAKVLETASGTASHESPHTRLVGMDPAVALANRLAPGARLNANRFSTVPARAR